MLDVNDFIDSTQFYEKGQLRTIAILDKDKSTRHSVTWGSRLANATNALPAVD